MKKVILGFGWLVMMHSGLTIAAEAVSIDKVKVGILSAPATYTIYQVACSDESNGAIASFSGDRRWCLADEGVLECYRNKHDAAAEVCSELVVASVSN